MQERYTDDQIARFKAMLRKARKVERLAPGELRRVADACGIGRDAAVSIHLCRRRADVQPAGTLT